LVSLRYCQPNNEIKQQKNIQAHQTPKEQHKVKQPDFSGNLEAHHLAQLKQILTPPEMPLQVMKTTTSTSTLTTPPATVTSTSTPITKEAMSVFSKKCLSCNCYYNHSESLLEDNCSYHPGSWKIIYQSNYVPGTVGNWTCCKSGNKDIPGCKKGQHKEDPQTTKIQMLLNSVYLTQQPLQFNDIDQQQQPMQGNLIELESTALQSTLEKQEKLNSRIKKHLVRNTDTLVGLALKYSVKVDAIKRINRMPTSDVQAYSQILIPPRDEDITDEEIKLAELAKDEFRENETEEEKTLRQKRSLQLFKNKTGASLEEAMYYLSLHQYSPEKAFQEFEEDIAWEKTHTFKTTLGNY